MRFRTLYPWLVTGVVVGLATVLVASGALAKEVRVVVVKKLELPSDPGAGDILKAFGRVGAKNSTTLRDSKTGQWYTCQVHSDGDLEDGKPVATWASQVCYFNVSRPQGNGKPELGS